jgi:hypothetical protein
MIVPICLHVVYGCFYVSIAELSIYSRDHITHKVENIYYLALYRKGFSDSYIIPSHTY